MSTTNPNQTHPRFADHDLRICELIKSLGFAPEVVYDIGGSNGVWTKMVRSVYPDARFEIFEPQAYNNPHYDQHLIPFLKSNPNLRLHTNLVADYDGTASLRVIGNNGVGASVLGQSTCEILPSSSRKLDSMIAAGDLPKPDLIKMDIQGAELMALRGGVDIALPAASVLALELWLIRGYGEETPLLGEVSEFLTQYNYYPFDFGDVYRESNGVLISQDVWYCRLGSPLSESLWKGRMRTAIKAA